MTHRFTVAQATIPAAVLAVVLAVSPVDAQDRDQDQNQLGRSLMERGAELFLEGLRKEMSPALEDLRGMADQFGPAMRGFISEMGPAFAEMLDEVKDWSRYHPPEILPNGDIIMRRKADPKDEVDEEAAPSGPTDI